MVSKIADDARKSSERRVGRASATVRRLPLPSLIGDRSSLPLLLAWRVMCPSLLRALPARRHAVVHGWPDDEGNAIEVLRALRRRYRGRIYWLLEDVRFKGPRSVAAELSDDARIVRVRKGSLRSLMLALTAETTFFTHGLFTAVDPPPNRLVVNLWHGDGPKLAADTQAIRSTVAVAGTRLWGEQRQTRFGLPASAVAIVGNPRVDQIRATPPLDILERLGWDRGKRTVLWLPTFRAASGPGGRNWRDGEVLSGNAEVTAMANALKEAAAAHDLQLVIKPHPLDADGYDGLGVSVLRHTALRDAGISLYHLLGAVDAVLSDISSVWVDYLTLDRPIGFYVPDLEDLQRRGKLNVDDLRALLPGVRIETPADAAHFLATVATSPDEVRPSRYPGYARIGVVHEHGAADRLLDWLNGFQSARGGETLFSVDERSSSSHRGESEMCL